MGTFSLALDGRTCQGVPGRLRKQVVQLPRTQARQVHVRRIIPGWFTHGRLPKWASLWHWQLRYLYMALTVELDPRRSTRSVAATPCGATRRTTIAVV